VIRLGLIVSLAVAIYAGPVAGIAALVGWAIGDLIVALWRIGVFGLTPDDDWSRVDVRPERRR